MKQKLNILIFTLLSFLIGTFSVSAQTKDTEQQYVDTIFHDNVDRTAEDFVIASLLVADPGTVLYSVLGHACIRLQCPAFGLDYCYSYESENRMQRILAFLAGKLKMGLFYIPNELYWLSFAQIECLTSSRSAHCCFRALHEKTSICYSAYRRLVTIWLLF